MSLKKKEERFDRALEEMGIRIKDADQMKVRDDVFDEITLLALYKLVHKKWISVVGGPISTGKEANVFYAEREGIPIAIKIYRIRTANFTTMGEYIRGDRRFASVRKNRKDLIFAWTKKEFSNLARAKDAGVPVPEPLVWDRNILIMSFLGEDERPYPQLRSVKLEDPMAVYKQIIGYIEALYSKAGLIHGDLSEFNILYGDQPYFIDMGQSVTRDHPRALPFLMRDVKNINRFFRNRCDVRGDEEIFNDITGLDKAEP
ncbi:MAG: RIO-type serine/threonine-protein kinase Rio1 [Methanoregula sp. PtaU1.Bin051]|nr:MAG: RIO-type serine/threonine-protein kinase Rio1 [Methanoregula sp. PtaU1.Bin051]